VLRRSGGYISRSPNLLEINHVKRKGQECHKARSKKLSTPNPLKNGRLVRGKKNVNREVRAQPESRRVGGELEEGKGRRIRRGNLELFVTFPLKRERFGREKDAGERSEKGRRRHRRLRTPARTNILETQCKESSVTVGEEPRG